MLLCLVTPIRSQIVAPECAPSYRNLFGYASELDDSRGVYRKGHDGLSNQNYQPVHPVVIKIMLDFNSEVRYNKCIVG